MDAGGDMGPLFTWLSAAPEWVQGLAVALVALLGGLLLLRLPDLVRALPAIADAVARVRGKGTTERERELLTEVEALKAQVASVESELRSIQHWREEQLRLFEMLLPRAQCLMPDCKQADVGELLREIVDTWRLSASTGVVAHGSAD